MKKGNKKLVIMDYITIIIAFITFIISLIVYNTFNYRNEVDFYLGMMVITFVVMLLGFKNLKEDNN